MGRGRSSGGSSRGMSRSSFGGGRGSSRSSFSTGSRHSHTTVFIGGSGHYHYGSGNAGPGMFIFMAIIFMIVGMIPVFIGGNMVAEHFRYGSVEAECVLNEEIHGWHYTTYEYEVDGEEYRNRSQEGWELPEYNKYVTIYYLKSDPNIITEENPGNIGGGIGLALIGSVFVGAGVLLLVVGIKQTKKKSSKDGNDINNSNSKSQQPLKPKVRCLYCGTKLDSDDKSCPRCGASRID